MNIKGINTNNVVNLYNKNSVKKLEKTIGVKATDRIEISSMAKSLGKIDDSTLNFDNTMKVEALKEKIEAGTYNVSGRITAESIMEYIKEGRKLNG